MWANNNRTHVTTATRKRILARDGHQCAQCGNTQGPFDIDHINNQRGPNYDHDENLQVLCAQCHKAKTARESGAWRKQIKRQTRKPIGLA